MKIHTSFAFFKRSTRKWEGYILGIGKSRRLDPEDRAAIAQAQQTGGQKDNRMIDRRITEAVKNGQEDVRRHQNNPEDQT